MSYLTYLGARCGWDGMITRLKETGECVECYRYRTGIAHGKFNGISGTAPKPKSKPIPVMDFTGDNLEVRD